MKRHAVRWVLLGALTLVGGAALAWQRRQLLELRREEEALRAANGEIATLQAERARLQAAQVSRAELESLRADHESITGLRLEIEALKRRVGSDAGMRGR